MSRQTPWAKGQSSLSSDRLKPQYRIQPAQGQSRAKGGSSSPQPTPPKSKAVLELESLITGLRKEKAGKDKKGGCFCQAREHDLSEYAPLCRSCGLILCLLNRPYHLCPSCLSPLLQPPAISALITKLETKVAEQLAKEEHERAVQAERIRQVIGAFPTLTGAPPPSLSLPQSNPEPQTHKVLSLNSKSRTVKMTSYSPMASQPHTPAEPVSVGEEEIPTRVPRPPEGVSYAHVDWDPERPWADTRNGAQQLKYIPIPKTPQSNSDGAPKSGRGRNKGGKNKEKGQTTDSSQNQNSNTAGAASSSGQNR